MTKKKVKKHFKKGDIVKIIGNNMNSVNKIGDTGVITDVDYTDDTCKVKVGESYCWGSWSCFNDLELVKKEYTKELCENKIAKWQKRLDRLKEPVYEYKAIIMRGDTPRVSCLYYKDKDEYLSLYGIENFITLIKETKRIRK